MVQNTFRLVVTFLLVGYVSPWCAVAQNDRLQQPSLTKNTQAKLDWESANANRMFILVNDGFAISSISVDTTHIEDLRAALKLQELVYRVSNTRMPIVDKRFVKIPWGKIHIAWDHMPMAEPQHAFKIVMKESDPTSYNPPKQVIIAGSAGGIDDAVSAFTKTILGIPLDALDDEKYNWEHAKTIAIPEKMKIILGSLKHK